jgi:hypothetical protein
MDLAFEDHDHVVGRSPFFEQNVAGIRYDLSPMLGEPKAIIEGKAMQGGDVVEGSRDLILRCGRNWRGDGGGKHP